MLPTDRLHSFAGVVLLLLALGVIITTISGLAVTDADPFNKADVGKNLVDIKDHETAHVISLVSSVIVDSVLSVAAAAVLYRVFRERNRALATLGLLFLLISSAVFIIADGGNGIMGTLANDFKNGGAGKLAAGNDTTLEIARAVGIFSAVIVQIGFTSLALSFLSFGTIILAAEERAGATPPRWIGWPALLAGVAGILAWFVVIVDVAFVFFIIAAVASLIWLIGLGLWFLRTPEAAKAMEPAAMRA